MIYHCILKHLSYYLYNENDKELHVEIYSIEFCPLCIQAKQTLPKKLKERFGNSVIIDIINVDKKDNKKYKDLIESIKDFKEEHENQFPVIKINNYFTIVGYDYYYDAEIINDIIRMDKENPLGKKLEKSRYIKED